MKRQGHLREPRRGGPEGPCARNLTTWSTVSPQSTAATKWMTPVQDRGEKPVDRRCNYQPRRGSELCMILTYDNAGKALLRRSASGARSPGR
ncbi:MAG: hypothetical protein MZV70_73165 [Desulfobacterales bacterium]|nr:hypothetical protein [Desulfobacterales bacterium]